MQKEIIINGVKVIIIEYEGREYYPLSFVIQKVLLRKSNSGLLRKNKRYGIHIKKMKINYGYYTGGIQEMYCISKEGLIIYLNDSKLGRLTQEQRLGLNAMLKYLGLEEIDGNKYINTYETNEYIQDCIDVIVKENPNVKFKKCTTCGHSYPEHKNFFNVDDRVKGGLTKVCRECNTNSRIIHSDNNKKNIYIDHGLEGYLLSKYNVELFYDTYIFNKDIKVPNWIKTKNNYLKIIKYYYDKGVITKDNITKDNLECLFGISFYITDMTIYEVYELLFGKDYKYYPWLYPKLSQKLTIEEGKKVLKNYIEINNIKIDNIFRRDYGKLLKDARLTQFSYNTLNFVVEYYNREYAGYLFKTVGKNYYKDESNRIFDLKYLIEKDMKIPIEKIPLYLTKFAIQKKSRSLYYILYSGIYYDNLFQWVDKCYPNKFIEADFVINPYRKEFDSIEESQIDDLLHSKFKNVIYNQRNNERTINLEGKIPDWFIFTNNGCYLIEYFGLYVDREIHNSRINDYKVRTDDKLDKYKELNGYRFIGLYPEDLKNDFKGLKNKISGIK